jgi:hypothetical protein
MLTVPTSLTTSLSQLREMLLKISVNEYEKEGHKYLQKIPSALGADQG